ncbi:MAG TPA: hypothetical protein VGQ58_04790 [Candidatus Limnocylindrales bacterium]|jgi:hypothetical protein|nr:hypothetical protein [Candidatus Limnocylindrales bacterium]
MTDTPPSERASEPVEQPARIIRFDLRPEELAVLRTALEHLISTLGREEADELEQAEAILARLPGPP